MIIEFKVSIDESRFFVNFLRQITKGTPIGSSNVVLSYKNGVRYFSSSRLGLCYCFYCVLLFLHYSFFISDFGISSEFPVNFLGALPPGQVYPWCIPQNRGNSYYVSTSQNQSVFLAFL